MTPALAIALLAWTLSRGEPARPDGPPVSANLASPMSQLEHSTEALRASVRRSYPSWSPEADLQRSTVKRIVGDSVDYREFGRRTLGGHWRKLSEEDRTEFIAELGRLIENRCLARDDAFGTDLKIRFERETVSPRGTASVFATASGNPRSKRPPMSIEYRLLWKEDHWSIYDLVTDGDSLVESYRVQFDRIIGREKFEGLLQRIRRQAEVR
ncbi:MAG TPA: ABC transporter substrate-binding protein [Polyangia bacterium]|nr:ABC transporter substrate-binding protein [Polyangia bacterium]